jgi:hypothetical protein
MFILGSSVMFVAALVEIIFGVNAERKSLEELHQQEHHTSSPALNSIIITNTVHQTLSTLPLEQQQLTTEQNNITLS